MAMTRSISFFISLPFPPFGHAQSEITCELRMGQEGHKLAIKMSTHAKYKPKQTDTKGKATAHAKSLLSSFLVAFA